MASALGSAHSGISSRADWPKVSSWTLACSLSAMIGVTAGTAAGLVDRQLDGNALRAQLIGFAIVVLGGLVAGLTLGRLQARVLLDVLGSRHRLWIIITMPVAGIGWAVASAPGGYAAGGTSTESVGLAAVVIAGLVVGAPLGALLGAAQALVLQPLVSHPWRWVGINALAWSPAVAVIALGAWLTPDSWPWLGFLMLTPFVGAFAGFLAGRISGSLIPALSGAPVRDLAVLGLLTTSFKLFLGHRLVGLAFDGSVTGRDVRMPVTYARMGERIVVVPRQSETKNWWRNIDGRLTDVLLLIGGSWRPGVAEVVRPGAPTYAEARTLFTARWPAADLADDQPVVVVSGLGPARRDAGW
jgi:hypothetical protein